MFVPPKREIGYVEIPYVPSGSESHGNVPVFNDKKITQLIENLHNSKGQRVDFQRRKKQKPFRPSHSKYANIPDHHVCWHCGNAGHYRHSCPKREHTWRGVHSNVRVNVQVPPKEKIRGPGMMSLVKGRDPNVPPRPPKMIWVWVPKKK